MSSSQNRKRGHQDKDQLLEVPDSLQTLATKLTISPKKSPPAEPELVPDRSGSQIPSTKPPSAPVRSLEEIRNSFKMDKPSPLLERIQAFLPQLQDANRDLERILSQKSASVDIEDVPSDQENYIEMNLGLGVFEPKDSIAEPESQVQIDTDRIRNPEGKKPNIGFVEPSTNQLPANTPATDSSTPTKPN
ncbi:hypothetical protein H4R33_005422 [Dimargaris cristalligena]|uniref:Uncharacterized protein n=1 Tax=Dimargaris cristalligena TaxID=215637 RepID=A0A4P9ZTX3_9FUNG|nr:hypothetical protein H4R33_005422 [Dimargaris cristalligena]RKP36975.1 hypothetical protein BJ085DRAFT_41214 [Dimargaris cristalligena]|eukprot:RKP36975.1 hypothetical protein BJ085DRAFT_41214 [Dimargaris cristalligena]